MGSPGKSYKQILVDEGESSRAADKRNRKNEENSIIPSMAEEADGMIDALKFDESAKEATDNDESGGDFSDSEDEQDMGKDAYLEKLATIRQEVQKFKEIFLLGAIWNGQVDIQKIKKKLLGDWKFLK